MNLQALVIDCLRRVHELFLQPLDPFVVNLRYDLPASPLWYLPFSFCFLLLFLIVAHPRSGGHGTLFKTQAWAPGLT
jgi:hypothetical protein